MDAATLSAGHSRCNLKWSFSGGSASRACSGRPAPRRHRCPSVRRLGRLRRARSRDKCSSVWRRWLDGLAALGPTRGRSPDPRYADAPRRRRRRITRPPGRVRASGEAAACRRTAGPAWRPPGASGRSRGPRQRLGTPPRSGGVGGPVVRVAVRLCRTCDTEGACDRGVRPGHRGRIPVVIDDLGAAPRSGGHGVRTGRTRGDARAMHGVRGREAIAGTGSGAASLVGEISHRPFSAPRSAALRTACGSTWNLGCYSVTACRRSSRLVERTPARRPRGRAPGWPLPMQIGDPMNHDPGATSKSTQPARRRWKSKPVIAA